MNVNECLDSVLNMRLAWFSRDVLLLLSIFCFCEYSLDLVLRRDILVKAWRNMGFLIETNRWLPLGFLRSSPWEMLSLLSLEQGVLSLFVVGLRHMQLMPSEL